MAIRVNPQFIDVLGKFGAIDVQLCYNCGDCTTICPHSDDVYRFPRKSMRLLQMGLEQKIETTLEPWLCYYCGQCSEQCPWEADPGETMMSLRRWLISRYDFTGIARQFFISGIFEIIAILAIAVLTGLFLFYYGFTHGNINIYRGEEAFLSPRFTHWFYILVCLIVAVFMIINAVRMWYLIMIKGSKFPVKLWLYLKRLYLIPWHFFTQKRYSECKKRHEHVIYMPWLFHLGLVLSYIIMFVLIIVFIEKLQSGPEIQWLVHIFGFVATVGLIAGIVYFIRGRLRKHYVQYKKSHRTDWVFLILLFVIVVSGITQHVFHRTGLNKLANITYVIHLMAVVPWLLRMPFSKWAHIVYRPLAMYFARIRKDILKRQEGRTIQSIPF
ncbi:MAG: 4Fe-4S dicluster domain-containing protein [Bacteroidales bacterium]